jgi:hypothetical protein
MNDHRTTPTTPNQARGCAIGLAIFISGGLTTLILQVIVQHLAWH